MAASANCKHGERDHFTFGFGRRVCPGIHLVSSRRSICMDALHYIDSYILRIVRGGNV